MNIATYLTRPPGSHSAVIQGERALTYSELRSRVGTVAAALATVGVEPGDRVALLIRNSPEFLEAMFAVWALGAAIVPVNVRLHPREYKHLLEDSGSRALIHGEEFTPALRSVELPSGLALLTAEEATHREATAEATPVTREPRDLAWLFYTSGTTGQPKGAMITHGNLEFMTRRFLADVYAASAKDRALHGGPLTHGSGLWAIPLTAVGATHLLCDSPSFDPEEVLRLIERHAVTKLVFLAPTMIKLLVEAPGSASADCSTLRFIGYGGAPIHPDDLGAALDLWGPVLCNIYGQGECPMTISMLSPRDHADAARSRSTRLQSVGRPRTGIEVAVCDEHGDPVAQKQVGEVCVKGPVVMRGYWRNTKATAEAFKDGWYRTGDLGALDDDGFLYLRGRRKELIITGGANVYPREVEEAILELEGIRDVAVIGLPDRHWGESVIAVVERSGRRAVTADAVIDACRAHLASYKKPRRVEFVEELPRNAYGKVLKRELIERFRRADT